MTQQNQLEIKYDPQVIKLLGNQLYHQFPAVLNELLTNSYDAGAEKVEILLDKEKNEFTISDDGSGMSYDDLQNKYLVIGRNRREEGDNPKRPATGKKGVGKLAPFGIADTITVITSTSDESETLAYKIELEEINKSSVSNTYHPKQLIDIENRKKGTTIIVSGVTLNNFKTRNVFDDAQSISRRFHKFGADFEVTISDGKDTAPISNNLYLDSLNKEFIWDIPNDLAVLSPNGDLLPLKDKYRVEGQLFSTLTPIKDSTARGIFTFSRGKLAAEAGFFEGRDVDQFHTYLTGLLNIDWIDESSSDDAIDTSRQKINWNFNDDFRELQELLQKLVVRLQSSWKKKRKEAKQNRIEEIIEKSDDSSLKSYSERINQDAIEKQRYEKVNSSLAEALEYNDDEKIQQKIIVAAYETSKPARQDSSPYKKLIPDTLQQLASTVGNPKIQKILAEISEPIMADKPEEFINAESLLLRALIDSGTSAYLCKNIGLLKGNITKKNPQNELILKEAEKWFEKTCKSDVNKLFEVSIQEGFNFKDKFITAINLLKIDKKLPQRKGIVISVP